MDEKICPILSSGMITQTIDENNKPAATGFVQCIKDKCACWSFTHCGLR